MRASGLCLPGLYLVATPIGNLRDISHRALDVLNAVEAILCEDKRVSQKLLTTWGIKKPLLVYNEHSDDEDRRRLLDRLSSDSLALISDAGTPLVSDPGYKLVRSCLDEGIAVTTIPGPCAMTSALVLSGISPDRALFAGFLPSRKSSRRKALQDLKNVPASLVFYETANRLQACLKDALEILGDRPAAVVREISKVHESVTRAKLSKLAIDGAVTLKGEITLVISAPDQVKAEKPKERDLALWISLFRPHMKARPLAQALSQVTGLSANKVYTAICNHDQV